MRDNYSACFAVLLLLAACSEDKTPAKTEMVTTQTAAAVSAPAAEMERGRAVYEYWCAPCHSGYGNAGTKALRARLGEQKSVLLERSDLGASYIKTVVRHGFQMMPPFKTSEISDEELDAVAGYVVSNGGRSKQARE